MTKIKDIAIPSGEILVFGGVYSNLQALEALMAIAKERNIPASNIICTGDVVAYCAQPEESVRAMIDWGVHCIAGNVELQLRDGEIDCGCEFKEGSRCDGFSKEWYPYAQTQLHPDSIDWMKSLPEFLRFDYAGKKAMVVHGSLQATAEFIFKSSPWEIKAKNFEEAQVELILSGHCGLPFHDIQATQYWLNAGVIGMPANDGTSRVWYMLLNDSDDSLSFQHEALHYDFKTASLLMQNQGLTPSYAKTLETGIWDNCEILPLEETNRQGEEIRF